MSDCATIKIKNGYFILLLIIILLVIPPGYCSKSNGSSLVMPQYDIDDCPPWYIQQENKGYDRFCLFYHEKINGKIVYQPHDQHREVPKGERVESLVQLGYCLTFDKATNETLLVNCPYNTANSHDLYKMYVVLNTSVSELNTFTCEPLNRAEVELCKRCLHNFGPSPFTLNTSCFDCSSPYHGWPLYLTFELIPLTIFFVLVTVLKIRPAQGYLNSCILLCQVISSVLTFSSVVPFIYSMGSMSIISLIFVRTIQTLYGFWNLDFFRNIIPGFCVSPALNNLDVVALQLISVFYPLSLIVSAWLVIHLYEHNFRPFVWMWRPFRRYLSHFSVTSNPKKTVVNVFTTFLILSYSKLIFIAANLVNKVEIVALNPLNGEISLRKHILFHDPEIAYFSVQHARYVAISFFLTFVFIVPPPVVLLLYPTSWFQKFLNKYCQKGRTLRFFAHACHSSFKNGLNGTRDCRHFAGAYLLLRIALFFCKTAIASSVIQWIMISFCFGVAAVLIAVYRPYKNPYLSALDFFFMLSFTISALFAAFVTTNNPSKQDNNYKLVVVVFVFIFLCTLLPLIYMTCLTVCYLKRKIKKLRHCLNLRRRDYLDISDFQYDPENSDIMDQGQAANILRSRVLNSDSFQSE